MKAKTKPKSSKIKNVKIKKSFKAKKAPVLARGKKQRKNEYTTENEEEFLKGQLNEELENQNSEEEEECLANEEMDMLENDDQNDCLSDKLTLAVVQKWEKEIKIKRSKMRTFKTIRRGLATAIESVKEQGNSKTSKNKHELKNSTNVAPAVFNAIVRLCLVDVAPALHQLFGIKSLSDQPKKNKKWLMYSPSVKNYLIDLITLTKSISEPSNVAAILKKGIVPVLPFFMEFPDVLNKKLIPVLINFWSTSEEKVRVFTVVVLFRIINSLKEEKKEKTLKNLYISYVNNCRFTSPKTWPLIDFMRMSLVELYRLDEAIAYRHAFTYVRQLAFHLRNAMLLQKKERLLLVYNWQYIHCLHLWADLLARTHPSEVMGSLIYPITQIGTGVITLGRFRKYTPTTFHVCDILTELSHKTNTFIPVLPHLLECLSSHGFIKSKSSAMQPFVWDCILKLSDAQIKEPAFETGIVDQVHDCCLKYLNTVCSSISFPELVFPFIIQVKSILKKNSKSPLCRKLKQLLEKVTENVNFISERRKAVQFQVTENKAIRNWEIACEQSNPPLRKFFIHWKSVNANLCQQEQSVEDNEDEFSIKAVRKRNAELTFNEDDDMDGEDEDDSTPEKPRKSDPKMGVSKTKKNKMSEEDDDDEYPTNINVQELLSSGDVVTEMRLSDLDESEEEEDEFEVNESDSGVDEADDNSDENDDSCDDDDESEDEESD